MMNRKSNFTLIELIVVIVVLGILAAIVIPNISSFQKEARDAQLTADARNIQTALDMFRAKSGSGEDEPTVAVTLTATQELDKVNGEFVSKAITNKTGNQEAFKLIDLEGLYPKYLRKAPKYVVNNSFIVKDATGAVTAKDLQVADLTADKIDYKKGQVLAGVLQELAASAGADGTVGTADDVFTPVGSAAVVKFISVVDSKITVVR